MDAEFERRSSLYVASDKKGLKEIEKEYDARIKYGLPVEYMSQEDLKDTYNIDRKGGLYNNVSGQLDAYKAALTAIDKAEAIRQQTEIKVETLAEKNQQLRRELESSRERTKRLARTLQMLENKNVFSA